MRSLYNHYSAFLNTSAPLEDLCDPRVISDLITFIKFL